MYASASSSLPKSALAAGLILMSQPSPYGSLLTSSGCSSNASFCSSTSPATGRKRSEMVFTTSMVPNTSTHHIGYAGELRSVHVSAHNGSQCIYSQAVQTVHGREDTEIEESASDRVRALCGEILPKGEVDARFSFTDGLLLACLGIACPCQQQGQANK